MKRHGVEVQSLQAAGQEKRGRGGHPWEMEITCHGARLTHLLQVACELRTCRRFWDAAPAIFLPPAYRALRQHNIALSSLSLYVLLLDTSPPHYVLPPARIVPGAVVAAHQTPLPGLLAVLLLRRPATATHLGHRAACGEEHGHGPRGPAKRVAASCLTCDAVRAASWSEATLQQSKSKVNKIQGQSASKPRLASLLQP